MSKRKALMGAAAKGLKGESFNKFRFFHGGQQGKWDKKKERK